MVLYRAVILDFYDFQASSEYRFEVHYQEHEVVRETPAFYIIKINGKERRVGKKSINQFAATTKEKAFKDLRFRNRFQIRILQSSLKNAEAVREFLKLTTNSNGYDIKPE